MATVHSAFHKFNGIKRCICHYFGMQGVSSNNFVMQNGDISYIFFYFLCFSLFVAMATVHLVRLVILKLCICHVFGM